MTRRAQWPLSTRRADFLVQGVTTGHAGPACQPGRVVDVRQWHTPPPSPQKANVFGNCGAYMDTRGME